MSGGCALLVAWLAGLAAMPAGPTSTDPVRVAVEFVATLDAAARATVLFPFDSPERLRWHRSPARRPGLRLGDATPEQIFVIHQMLRSVLSDRGYRQVAAIIEEQDALADEEGIGSGYYWMAVYGAPGAEGSWAWRFGGHHVSIHVTFEGDRLIALTPLLLGGETVAGTRAIAGRGRLASELVRSLSAEQREQAILATARLDSLELDPRRPARRVTAAGVRLHQLNAHQRELIEGLLREYLETFRSELLAGALRCTLDSAMSRARFAWAGSPRPGEAHYYRLTTDLLTIEYINHGRHLHSLLRAADDFGLGEPVECSSDE